MEERRDYIALDWVTNEIQETLQQALQAMDSYVQNPEDVTKLRFGLSYVHQVLGSLRMVEFTGAALLAEELEYVLQALVQQKISQQSSDDAILALQTGMRQLPVYLQKVKNLRGELPAALLPLINDLRAVRGQHLASESQLFSPQLPVIDGQRISVDAAELNEMAGKLRQMFQIAVMGFLRGSDVQKNLNYLAKVFARMVKLCDGRSQQALWKAGIALTEGLLNQTIPSSPAVKYLLRQIDGIIRRFVEQGDAALDLPAPDALLRNMLFYIAASKASSRFISEIRQQCELDTALPGTTSLDAGLDDGALNQIDAQAVNKIVGRVSQALHELAAQQASRAGNVEALRELPANYRAILDALAVLGMAAPLRAIQQEYAQLSRQLANNAINPDALANGAEKLAQVADSFAVVAEKPAPVLFNDSEEAQEHLDRAHAAVIREARNGLEQAKEAVIEFVARQWQHECLENIPALLKEISGSLRIADMQQAAAVVNACELFVRQDLLSSKDVPEWQLLDTLADAIASIDYYLELVAEDNEFDTSHVLSVAESSAARLGYPLTSGSIVAAPEFVAAEENAPPFIAAVAEVHSETDAEKNPQTETEAEPETVASNVIAVSFGAPSETTVSEMEAEPEADEMDQPVAVIESADSESFDSDSSDSEQAQIAPIAAQPEMEDDVDPEIVEIFIEEAGEVLDTINEYFAQWLLDPMDSETMPIIRRAFHTLKGSGRMVGATDIGEMAWSIENMLNRVIDGTVKMDQQRLDLVAEAKELVPDMVAAFSERRGCDMTPVNALMEKAFAFAKEQHPEFAAPEIAADINHDIQEQIESSEASELYQPEMPEQITAAIEPEEIHAAGWQTETADNFSIDSMVEDDVESIAEEQPATTFINDDDRELLEIFAAEATTHLEQLNNFIADARDRGVMEISEELQRALHTLKGSANMAGVLPIAQIVTPVEKMIKDLRAAQLRVDETIVDILQRAANYIEQGIAQLATQPYAGLADSEEFIAEVVVLHQQRIDAVQDAHDNGISNEGLPPEVLSRFLLDVMDQLVIIGDEITAWRNYELSSARIDILPATASQIVALASAVNIAPIEELSQGLYQCLQAAAGNAAQPSPAFFALTTVTIDTLIDMLDRIAGQQQPIPDHSLLKRLNEFVAESAAASALSRDFAFDSESTVDYPATDDTAESAEDADISALFIEQFVAPDAVKIEDESHARATDESELEDNVRGGEVLAEFAEVVATQLAELSAETEIASTEEVESNSDLAVEMQLLDDSAVDESVHEPVEELADESMDEPVEASWFTSADTVSADATSDFTTENTIEETLDAGVDFSEFDDEPQLLEERLADEQSHEEIISAAPVISSEEEEEFIPSVALPVDMTADAITDMPFVEDEETADEIDPDILEIFLEEAADLLDGLDETISGWNEDPNITSAQEEMQRLLHTLKGGARLSGLRQLGNLTHNFETFLIHAQQNHLPVDSAFLAQVQSYQDQLVQRVDAVRRGEKEVPLLARAEPSAAVTPTASASGPLEMTEEQAASDLAAAAAELQRFEAAVTEESSDTPTPESSTPSAPAKSADNVLPFNRPRDNAPQRQDVVPFTAKRSVTASPRRAENTAPLDDALTPQHLRKTPQEAVKISAQLLEQLVNLAGETSISRGRVEAQVSEVLFSLDDMQATVNRLHDQLRRLDQETEAQILFRQEQLETEGAEDFDPLEFDRYSLLQQLARSLMESASDLVDIRGTLVDKSKDMETLLVQQSRINTDLQEGLMRSRMVPFARMVPRLRRIIRQVATELDKDVEMIVDNAEGELDRTMLEKINAPLEHMLRNAVDHGIESADVRTRIGKPAQGTVRLSLLREGADVVLVLEDDGGGIDVDAVRAKAIERGLLSVDAHISDHEALQFIMQPGFSTAKQVTQISGRGVGMDVVASEIKQLGGNLDIQSVKGKGTRFVVRLPFTVSINRALMVSVAGDSYAIPLNTIEGIVRVSPFELEAYYQPDAPPFEYAGQPYSVRYLGSLLHTQDQPNLEGLSLPLPVILVRAGEYAVAVQVDSLQGSREVVVKSLGAQFAMVQGLSGATVLGDGSVVVILDLMAMLRAEILQASRALLNAADEKARIDAERPLLVMVVDDSVTVRKVTTRFLERQGMEVVTAKDGADAVAHLLETDRIPDVMLLDIEMPRMDGFEVASRVRHNSRLKDIPIIMITSRTGDKHRERAMSLGVNRYLGKPYQESVVLENIAELTGREN